VQKYRGSIAGFFGGTAYAVIFSYLFSIGEKYSINFLEFISIAMLVVSPISVGIITVLFLTKEQAVNKKFRTYHPWLPVLGWSVISIALA
jgi:ABC-type molybdate transport system permease subunit